MSQDTRKEQRKPIPKFTREQLEWLELICPEKLDENATFAQLQFNQGRRSLLNDVRLHVQYVVKDINTPRSL